MHRIDASLINRIVEILLCWNILFLPSALCQEEEKTVDNRTIAQTVAAGVAREVIIPAITDVDVFHPSLHPRDLVALANARVSDNMILPMTAPTDGGSNVGAQPGGSPDSSSPATPPAAAAETVSAAAQPLPSDVPASGRARVARGVPDYALPVGRIELGGFGGANAFEGAGQGAKPSVGGEFAVGLSRYFAVYGEAVWNRVLGLDLAVVEANASLYDISGGLQMAFPNNTRFVPYLRAGPACVHATANAKLAGTTLLSESANKFAANFGGGIKTHINERLGGLVDVRVFRGSDVAGFARVTIGLFYQFK